MKKYILKTSVLVALLLLINTSCSDSFVERSPVYSIDSENYFNTKQDYDNALIAAYDLLQSTYINVMMGEIASDNTLSGGESASDVIGIQQVDNMTQTPVNSNLKDIWDWMFAGVNRANYILEFKDKTNFEGKAQVLAEARFLRAYYHFELVKWFGGIPLKGDVRFKLDDEKTIPRSSKEEVYLSIISDLKLAIADLSPIASQTGRVTKGAAQALLGKAYLFQSIQQNPNKYLDASNVLKEVILSGKYSLIQNYNTIFENEGENGTESVFEVQYSDAEGASFNCLQCSEGNVAVGFNGIRNFSGPLYESGFSFNVPTQEAYDSYESGDVRKDIAILNIEAFKAANSTYNNGVGVTYGTGYKNTGFFNRKYLPRKGDSNIGDQNLTNPNNYRAIRYADVLLMAAEAYNGIRDDASSRGYLNQVRSRAFGNSTHDVTSAAGVELGNLIQKERRSELMGEGHRFFDLVRTQTAAGTIPGYVEGKNNVFPVPQEEIQFSNGNWQQNTGY